jgi:hypothetical protein
MSFDGEGYFPLLICRSQFVLRMHLPEHERAARRRPHISKQRDCRRS